MYRILVADDEPIILSGIKHLIDWKTADAEIAGTASNGAEAYRMIKSEHPDIVITDIRMPVMDGITVLEVKYDRFLPEIAAMAVQVPGRRASACSKYALCRRFD